MAISGLGERFDADDAADALLLWLHLNADAIVNQPMVPTVESSPVSVSTEIRWRERDRDD